jgi:cephalosporin hydroxylase
MRRLAGCDVVLPTSAFSGDCLRDFWRRAGVPGGAVHAVPLPGELAGVPRASEASVPERGRVDILCVSTLEPRKNHRRLLAACRRLAQLAPGLDWTLTLVGNRYAGAFDIAEEVTAAAAADPRIRWLGVVDDETLHRCYRDATFTVYPSLIEGFGLPVLESLWHGRPCICSGETALGEVAAGGGCLTTTVSDEEALAEAIRRLATDPALRARLAREAVTRHIRTWDDYVRDVLAVLAPRSQSPSRTETPMAEGTRNWQDVLYPGCLREHWQMNDSERMALTALLARRRPHCAIEIGTYEAGSLSLLSQYADVVFSIDIDPSIPARFTQFPNVSFLTGPSSVVLPLLLRELDAAGIAVEFILVDADHSTEGVRGDLERVLAYVPKAPLFVAVHDSFNPDCRRGMLAVDWAATPWVQWVDVDFVPGRLVEHDGPFHHQLWGGLALAYLTPTPREGPLVVQRSADGMFRVMEEYVNRSR